MSFGVLVGRILQFYVGLIVIYVLMSWFVGNVRNGMVHEIYRVLGTICEPYLGLFRRLLPPVMVGGGGLDISPIIAIIVLQLVADFLGRIL